MRSRRIALAVAAAALATAVALVMWPLHEPGATGNAIRPHYRGFGWYGYRPLSAHPTLAEMRAAGIHVPQDAVRDRRRAAALAAAAAGAALGVWGYRRRNGVAAAENPPHAGPRQPRAQ